MSVIERLIEFGGVLGIGALVSIILHSSIIGLGYNEQTAIISSWLSFFVIPMIYYKLLRVNVRGRMQFS